MTAEGPGAMAGTPEIGWRDLAEELKALAGEMGLGPGGIAPADPSRHGNFLDAWIEAGYHGEMSYLTDPVAVQRRKDVRETMPDAQSVLVVAEFYDPRDPPGIPDDPARGVIARYARGRDYHKVLKRKLSHLARWLDARVREATDGRPDGERTSGDGGGVESATRSPTGVYVDTGPILERELGQRAGLGWFGRNTMLIDPRRGSYFFLGCLLTPYPLPTDEPFSADRCGTCRRCVDACPTGALLDRNESGAPVMDARRCISYLTIENRGAIPRELRPLMGNRVFGCDICQEVCPFNVRFAEETSEPGYAARLPSEPPAGVEPLPLDVWHPGTESASLVELLEMALDKASWDSFSRGSAIRRAGRAGFARNVCVGLGNWGSSEAFPVLMSALKDPEPLVRGHSAWALGRIGSDQARAAVQSALPLEKDASVREEMEKALRDCEANR